MIALLCCCALSLVQADEAVDKLVKLLDDKVEKVRIEALKELAQRGAAAKPALPAITKLLKKMIVPRIAKGTPPITTSIPHAIVNAQASMTQTMAASQFWLTCWERK